jgi:hypothetical protein
VNYFRKTPSYSALISNVSVTQRQEKAQTFPPHSYASLGVPRMKDWYLDAALVPLGMLLLTSYHVYFVWRVHCDPLTTIVGANHLNRKAWVRGVMRVRLHTPLHTFFVVCIHFLFFFVFCIF